MIVKQKFSFVYAPTFSNTLSIFSKYNSEKVNDMVIAGRHSKSNAQRVNKG